MPHPPDTIATQRLILRRPRPEDAVSKYENGRDPDVARYADWVPHASLSEAVAHVEGVASRWQSGEEYSWVTTVRPGDRAIGSVSYFVRAHATADGVDLEPTFVEIARSKVPGGSFWVGDMRQFDLQRRYDVVLCLFSAIGHLLHEDDVVAALRCFAAHLADGGVIIVEPWLTPDAWQVGRPHMVGARADAWEASQRQDA